MSLAETPAPTDKTPAIPVDSSKQEVASAPESLPAEKVKEEEEKVTAVDEKAANSSKKASSKKKPDSADAKPKLPKKTETGKLVGQLAPSISLKNWDGEMVEIKPGECRGVIEIKKEEGEDQKAAEGSKKVTDQAEASKEKAAVPETKPGELVPLVLFFYPKAGSYGCTKEACQFRDAVAEIPNFSPESLKIVGISGDPVPQQKKFVEKNKLKYPVLSDTSSAARLAYGIGRAFFGLSDARVTVVIDKHGIVRAFKDKTADYRVHKDFVVKWLETFSKEEKAKEEAEKTKEEGDKDKGKVEPVQSKETAEVAKVAEAVQA
ncbi:thioredoxin-like protein [Mycena floridula]|nr:thioredoxin-like protein [Mycena floridula]